MMCTSATKNLQKHFAVAYQAIVKCFNFVPFDALLQISSSHYVDINTYIIKMFLAFNAGYCQ